MHHKAHPCTSEHHATSSIAANQRKTEKLSFVSVGFDNLKTAVDPLSEEDEKALISLMLEELNNLYPVKLCMDIICDRFMDDDVFVGDTTYRTDRCSSEPATW